MQTLQKKYPFVNRRKLGLKEREQVGGEKQLSAAEETLKLAAEELWNYKACELEKVMAEQSREVAYLKCRLEVIHKQRLPEESRKHKPMAAGPDRKIPPWRGQCGFKKISFPRCALHTVPHGLPFISIHRLSATHPFCTLVASGTLPSTSTSTI
ncbi:uncharacterized protein LOC121019435 isoform X7 [Herpailurus yagouaroundi]|uniref:uncharacterized protein LOC121019435 isoform X7 n=1 Tax=Herpailurus yagouaroundi TaxID=1608482 RepID=UPI001AD7BFF5|nr:uncharacterized protein LOC121019435 isoform X7 [Puma yagouaroundi]